MSEVVASSPEPPRISTGVEGLDEVLGGGLHQGHLYLIEGDSGAGKTTLGLQFLLEGRRRGEPILYITLSETVRELAAAAASHGWSLDGVEIVNLAGPGQPAAGGETYTFFWPDDIELNDLTRVVLETVAHVRPARLVFDPFSDVRLLARDPLVYRRQVIAMRDHLTSEGCTVLLMQEATRHATVDPQAEGLVHGFLTLHQEAPAYGGQRRRLRVHKLRGSAFRDGYHDFKIERGGLKIFPRLVASEHFDTFTEEVVESGVAELDALLGGGPSRGSSLLLLGPAGVGKSCLASQYAVAAVRRRERVCLFLFDESVRAFLSRGEGLGMELRRHVESGLLRLRQVDPAEMSPGEFAHLVRREVEEEGAGIVIVDSLNGYMNAMPEERFLTTHLHELITYLGYKQSLTIFTLGQHGLVGEGLQPPVDVSYLADTVLLLRYFEAFGAVRRSVSVIKKRNGTHDLYIREMQIGPEGIHVGETLSAFHGVLSGRPRYTGEPGKLANPEVSDGSERSP